MEQRDTFSSNIGFVLACAGSAVGLGNLWMFPWRLGEYGGAAFLLPYLVFVYVLGTTGLMGEFALGRWAQKGPMGAFDKALRTRGHRFGRSLGAYPVLCIWGVLVFYSIVAGWVLRYAYGSVSGGYFKADHMGAYFEQLAGQAPSALWQSLALGITLVVLVFGIEKGVERVSKIIMPVLLLLFFFLAVWSITLPGALEGVRYILVPDWSHLLKPMTWGMALGQAFFTVSLGGSSMVVYGSYLRRDADIPKSAFRTVTLDTLAALLASLMIIPAVFAYQLDPTAGPPLLFIVLPEIFREMPGGRLFGILFFAGIFLAAISSLINIKEAVVEGMMDQLRWSRGRSLIFTMGVTLACGYPLATDMSRFTSFVDLITVYTLPAGAVVAAVVFFWVFGVDKARQEINVGAGKPLGRWWNPVAKYVFVGIAALIVVLQITVGIG